MAVAELHLGTLGLHSCGGTDYSAVVILLVSPFRKQLNGVLHLCFALVKCSLIPCTVTGDCIGHFGGRLCSADVQRPNDYRQHEEAAEAIVNEPS